MTSRSCLRLSAAACLLALGLISSAAVTKPDAAEIVRRSTKANENDWKQAPNFSFVERDADTKKGVTTIRTYRVLMIEGSPYERLIAVNDKPLSGDQEREEQRKLQEEISKRRSESPKARAKRIAHYNRERNQDHVLMREMGNAFHFELAGETKVNGRDVYVIRATPRPGYEPINREAKVLTGMRGTMWIDKETFQWVKVEAEVFRPVKFGLFIAKVGPGTRFLLEQGPVRGDLWLPTHFQMQVNASVLWTKRKTETDQTFRDYKPETKSSASARGGPPTSTGAK